jgi:hypothetical protein
LKSKSFAKQLIQFKVGDGPSIFLWLDRCHPSGILVDKLGFRVVYDADSIFEAKVASVMHETGWNWSPARSEALVHIQSQLPCVHPSEVDQVILSLKNLKYSIKAAWEDIRKKNPKVEWWNLVW